MDNFNHDELINGANPAFIWGQLMDYFARTAKYMRHIYKDKNQTNTPITWADLDTLNERIRKDLDVIYAGTTNVSDDAPNKNENKTRNNMKRTIRLTESDLHRVIKESVKRIIREQEDFEPHGYKTTSNLGGHEVQISPDGDGARFRFYGGEPTDWLPIEFDEDGAAYVDTERGRELLSDYMRF